MDAIIKPTKLKGDVVIPPSKSLAHRAIICASLARGRSVVSNVSMSDDIIATVDCMRNLGANIISHGDKLEVVGIDTRLDRELTFDCNESGSTLRFMLPIALSLNGGVNKFVGRGKLGERPMDIYKDICMSQGIAYEDRSLQNPQRHLDIVVKGNLKSGKFIVDGGVSSQFITGLMFALPTLEGDSEIVINGKLQSVGYIDLTLTALCQFGIEILNEEYQRFYIKGGQKYAPCDYYIEGDYSQAAFFEVAEYLGNDVRQIGLNKDSLQGDKVIVDFVEKLRSSGADEHLVFDGEDCPDIIPIFALACCLREGHTDIINLARLRIKECDRLKATAAELAKLGADIVENDTSLSINGVENLRGAEVESHGDHRMAMTLAIASTRAIGEVKIIGAHSVSKSYPNFFDDFIRLGGRVVKA